MEQSKHLLVFSYYFPPNDGVGGRRWAKFAYYLAQKGYKITIVTTQVYSKETSFWVNDIHPKVEIIRLHDKYPDALLNPVNNLISKLKYRFSLAKVKRKTKGNMYDVSVFTQPEIDSRIREYIISNNIKNIIVSGTPFAYFYYITNLAQTIKGLNVILDYRDLWTDSKHHYGQNVRKTQGVERFSEEQRMEDSSLNKCQHVFVVSRDLKEILELNHPQIKNKITIIPNGFDVRDNEIEFSISTEPLLLAKSKTIVFSYFGTINCGQAYYLKLLNALQELTREWNNKGYHVSVNFYGNTNKSFEADVRNLNNPWISNKPRLSMNQMAEVAHTSDFLLYIKREDELPNSFATKFYDYLRFRKFIVILSPLGDVTDFVQDNKIGLVLQENEISKTLDQLLSKFVNSGLEFNKDADFSEFNIECISNKIENYLI